MAYMDLHCSTSFNLKDRADICSCSRDILYLGCGYGIYLTFELPPLVFLNTIKDAKLRLFKIPSKLTGFSFRPKSSIYSICPTLEYYNFYNNWYEQPEIDSELIVDYVDQACMGYTEIDITVIVRAWIESNPENKGLLLTGARNGPFLAYASEVHEIVGMRPTLRLTYENFNRPLSVAPCIVKVNEHISSLV